MKNFTIAIFISILIHFILLISFKDNISQHIPIKEKNTAKYTYIKLANIKQKEEKIIKKIPLKKKIKKSNKKPVKVIKQKIIKKKNKIKKPTIYKKVVKKDIKKAKRKSVFTKKQTKVIKKKKIQKIKQSNIQKIKYQEQQKEIQDINKLDNLTKSYIKLYGKKYFDLSKKAKTYLKKNLNDIGRITQEYLIYPEIAIKTRQAGTNILEFILQPNGDIKDLKIIGSSSYTTLDENSIQTIRIAYKDYPRPEVDTLVRIYVSYRLY